MTHITNPLFSHVVNGNGECSNGEVLNGKKGKLSRRDDELIRLIGQHLISIGLEQSAKVLVNESGNGHDSYDSKKMSHY